ncbi:MAG TPA: ribosome small subunit-dependent GTPase A, partial [Mycobacteriales bacterium]|nr:ribosome small subunit-dependent GTPase A [Mycobacteriales bacterium]
RGRFACIVGDVVVTAMRARELGRRGVVVGDDVALVGDLTGAAGALARIVRVQPRRTTLRRTADDIDPVERVIVANAEQLVVVSAVTDPTPRPRLIDRCLVAAHDAGLEALIVLTKTDLADPAELLDLYARAEVLTVLAGRGQPLELLATRLTGRSSVLVGHSGVGKSSLVNALVPDADRRIGAVNAVTGRGRHVSVSVLALRYGATGWLVDTPGVRSFGLAHVPRDRLVQAFPELVAGLADCAGDCDHLDAEVCGFDARVRAGAAPAERLDSLRRLLVARDAED